MSRHSRRDLAWQRLRGRLIRERGARCERCGRAARRLELHHQVALADGGTDSPTNLEVLCRDCHFAEHRRHHVPADRRAWLDRLDEVSQRK